MAVITPKNGELFAVRSETETETRNDTQLSDALQGPDIPPSQPPQPSAEPSDLKDGRVQTVAEPAAETDAETDSSSNEALSFRDELILHALLQGKSISAAARLIGVSRATAHRLKKRPRFVAEYNRQCEESRTAARARVINLMLPRALDYIEDVFDDAAVPPNAKIAATKLVLKMTGLDKPERIGPTEPDEVERLQEEAKRHADMWGSLGVEGSGALLKKL